MKALLATTAVLEGATGVGLMAAPGRVAGLLLGADLGAGAGEVVGRVAGAALVALAVACWRARADPTTPAAHGVVLAMLAYNALATAVLAYAGAAASLEGLLLWPAVIAHAGLAGWCLAGLRAPA